MFEDYYEYDYDYSYNNGYKNFFTNTEKNNVPAFILAANFTGLKIQVHETAYDIHGNVISVYSAIIWKTLKRSKRQKRLFDLYLKNFKHLCFEKKM